MIGHGNGLVIMGIEKDGNEVVELFYNFANRPKLDVIVVSEGGERSFQSVGEAYKKDEDGTVRLRVAFGNWVQLERHKEYEDLFYADARDLLLALRKNGEMFEAILLTMEDGRIALLEFVEIR